MSKIGGLNEGKCLFCKGDTKSIQILFETFQKFSKASRLIANPNDYGGVDTTQDQIKAYTRINKGEVSFSTKRLSIAQCEPLPERMSSRISL